MNVYRPLLRPFVMLILFVFTTACLSAQSGKMKKADEYFETYNYPEAAELYKKILSKEENDDAKIKLADCYRLMNKPVEAEYWYEQIIDLEIGDDEDFLHYGMALKMNGKCELAKEMFLEFASRVPADTRGLRLAESCDKEEYFNQDPGVYNISNLNINSIQSDFGPTFFGDGIVFASARGGKFQDKLYEWTNAPFLDLFYSEAKSNTDPIEHESPELFKGQANTWMHEGTTTFSRDEESMFFTRNNYYKGKKRKDSDNTVRLKIYTVDREGDSWGEIKEMPFNSDEYSVGHPTLSPDGQALYFVSDMQGGYGEEDIYISFKDGDTWGNPMNLGPEINSEGREMFPFIHEDGTLYFASDALPGLGGLDIFSSSQMEDGSWSAPENLRVPINSNHDDFGMILDEEGTLGYLSSNRPGGLGDDDIYSFSRSAYKMEGLVIDIVTEEPMEGVIVQLIEDDIVVQERTTFSDGKFSFPIVKGKVYEVRTSKANYQDGMQSVSTEGLDSPILNVKVPMTPDELGGIYCSLTGLIYEAGTLAPITGATVRLVHIESEDKLEKTYVTEEPGTYFFELETETDYVVYATKEHYFTATKRVSTKGRDCTDALMKDLAMDIELRPITVNEEKPTVIDETIIPDLNLNHIYYDLDKSFIRPDAAAELDKIVRLMYENPGLIVELGSHTDSRATDSYNLELSQRRAESAVNFVVSRGVSPKRIYAKGYGESQLVNGCFNGAECSEDEHQANRRTEFKIIGYSDNAVYSVPRYYGGGFGGSIYEFPEVKPQTNVMDDVPFDTSFDEPNQPASSTASPYMGNKTDSEPESYFDSYDDNSPTEPVRTYTDPNPRAGTTKTTTYTPAYTDTEPVRTYTDPNPRATTYPSYDTEYVGRANSDDIYDQSYDTSTDDSYGTEYKIQVSAARNPDLNKYSHLRDLGSIDIEYNGGLQKVVIGSFSDRSYAKSVLEQIRERGFRDAFMVTYQDGQRLAN